MAKNDPHLSSIKIHDDCFTNKEAVSLNKDGLDKKYNVKFDNEDLALLSELQSFYSIRNKSDLIQSILCSYLKNSLHEKGVSKDVSLMIAMVADAYSGADKIDYDVSSWEKEAISTKEISDGILNYGPTGKKNNAVSHNGVEHSDSFIQVGIKLLRFCEMHNLMGSDAYKKLFESIRSWNKAIKDSEK